jgi:hypothetical protein
MGTIRPRPTTRSRSPDRSRWGRRAGSRRDRGRDERGRGSVRMVPAEADRCRWRRRSRSPPMGSGESQGGRGRVRTAPGEADHHTTMGRWPDAVRTPAIRSQQPAGLRRCRITPSRAGTRRRQTMAVNPSGRRPFDGWDQEKERNRGGGQDEHPTRRPPDDGSRRAALGTGAHHPAAEPEPATIRPASEQPTAAGRGGIAWARRGAERGVHICPIGRSPLGLYPKPGRQPPAA